MREHEQELESVGKEEGSKGCQYIKMGRHYSACEKGGIGMTPMMDGLLLIFVPRPDAVRCSALRHHEDVHESQKAPTKTGWVATDKEQPGKPNVRARWVAKEMQTRKTSISRFDASAGRRWK